MSPPTEGGGKGSNWSKLVGSGAAGAAELIIFHPVDTIAKRLMSNQQSIGQAGGLQKVLFKSAADKSALEKARSLFPGMGFAAGYKISQRILKFGGQPIVKDHLNGTWKSLDLKPPQIVQQGLAGSVVGALEVFLLPLDVLKIKMQTNASTMGGRGLIAILKQEKIATLYAGWEWTLARNIPGSFALFAGSSFVKRTIFGLDSDRNAKFYHMFCASIGGSVASIVVASPLDVIKTRIQNRPFDSPKGGLEILKDLIREEGAGGFFKGLIPKIATVGPKLIFGFTIAQYLIELFERS